MRGAQDLRELKVEVGGKSGKIVGFWVTEFNTVYAKIEDSKGHTTNYRLSELPEDIKVMSLCEEDEQLFT